MADGQPCSPVSRRKRRVQRQIDHVLLGAVTKGKDGVCTTGTAAPDTSWPPTGQAWMTTVERPLTSTLSRADAAARLLTPCTAAYSLNCAFLPTRLGRVTDAREPFAPSLLRRYGARAASR